jgi:hypothetical protein
MRVAPDRPSRISRTAQVHGLLTEYVAYYHRFRAHLSLDMDCPTPRPVESPEAGAVLAVPKVGGLHHHYERRAA